jgi:hypothetical protein
VFNFLNIKAMQIKIYLDFISPQLEWSESKVITTNVGRDVAKQEPLYTGGGNEN